MQINSIKLANQVLAKYIPQVREMLGKDLTLVRMIPLLKILGNPQDKLKIIHVAGTSGKTSTVYYIASMLKEAGMRVGHTVSPHIDSITERVQIDISPITDEEFCKSLSEFLDLVADVNPMPTYFELIIAYVYWYFAKIKVDYAVIETGLGGSFDATNVSTGPDKICVLTDIGFDHMHVLGNTLAEIAGQKAGIIHNQNQVFTHEQSPEIMYVLEANSNKQNATLNVLSNNYSSRGVRNSQFSHLPEFQKRNWSLAYNVYEYIASRDSLPSLNDEQLTASMKVKIPGRLDIIKVGNKSVIMDGAHNEQKMTALVSSFQKLYPDTKADILISLKQGKEYGEVLPLLKPFCKSLIITSFTSAQDLPSKSINPSVLSDAAHELGFENVSVVMDHDQAYNQLIEGDNEIILITGSFYLISNLRTLIMSRDD